MLAGGGASSGWRRGLGRQQQQLLGGEPGTLGAGGDAPQVNVALSRDDGVSFGAPLRIDHGDPIGRCHLVALADGSFLATWLEVEGEEAEIRTRRVTAAGKMDPSEVAAMTVNDRATGFPRLARAKDDLWVAWTQPGDPSHIRILQLP